MINSKLNTMRIQSLFLVFTAALLWNACVPARKYEEEKAKRTTAETELADLKKKNSEFETKVAEMDRQLAENKKQITGLQSDTTGCGMRYRLLTFQYDQLTANYELLLKQNKELMARQSNENTMLVGKLNMTQEQLIMKEDSLKKLDVNLKKQKRSLDSLTLELKKREARVLELEKALAAKDSAVVALKKKVKDALVTFEGKGINVTEKNGKVYVSMDDKLMFSSGSTKVSSEGEKALKELAKVLEQNPDINIMVEGHTDDVPYKGSGEMKDNWDLSVMRATSVTKILLANGKIDPKRITAAGRGEHFPLDNGKTAEARAKNRRTEIILTPKLDELFKVLDTN
ncbi:MAG: OmpA family protein [Bacteroidia bacterium]